MKALDTIFYALNASHVFDRIGDKGRVLLLNAYGHKDLPEDVFLVQWFKPAYDALQKKHDCVYADIDELRSDVDTESFDLVLLLYPKAHKEALHWLSQAFRYARSGADIVVAGANDAGGKRIAKDLKILGVEAEHVSKFKARAAVFKKPAAFDDATSKLLLSYDDFGALSLNEKTNFWTQPGIFGWQKVDAGSQLLIEAVTENEYADAFTGRGADFGSGYGYLSRCLLDTYEGINSIQVIDADYRSVEACRKNLSDYSDRVAYHWHDLSVSSVVSELDWLIMNPPFHENKDYAVHVGESFLRRAAASLRPAGHLFMVANAHLPYEKILNDVFKSYETITTAKGFKVIHARR